MKDYFQEIPPSKREEYIDQFCLTYPTWFFELLTEVEGERFVLEEYQIKYLLDESSFKITNKTRQAGASLGVSAAKFWKAYTNKYHRTDIVSVNLKEATGKIQYIRGLWESLPWRWQHPLYVDNKLQIGFHSGREHSEINSIAASAGVRGGKKDIVFDEAAWVENFGHLYVAAMPATLRGNGGIDVISTPQGQIGKFYEIYANVDNKYPSWSRHFFGWWEVSFFIVGSTTEAKKRWTEDYGENWSLMPELLEEFGTPRLKEFAYNMSWEEFEQEFCGRFVDESSSYYPWDLINKCLRDNEAQHEGHTDYIEKFHVRPDDNTNPFYIGIDFATGKKGGDTTSIQVVERIEDGTVVHRFWADLNHSNDYDDLDKQQAFFDEIIAKFRPERVHVDSTGLGVRLADELKNKHGGLIEPVNFNPLSKGEMALNLKSLLERQAILLQRDNKRLAGQIHNIKRKTTANGTVQYSGEPHDDMFWALCLACKGISRRSGFRIITLD